MTKRLSSMSQPSPLALKRLVRATGVSGLLVGSGYLLWKVYDEKHRPAPPENLFYFEKEEEPVFISIPSVLMSRLSPDPLDEATSELKAMFVPRHLRRPWKLLRDANEAGYEKHISAVRELASMRNMLDGDYRQLGQACQMRTAVGLARSKNVDLRFFLPPPPNPHEIENSPTTKLFQDILSSLPSINVNECIRSFTTQALEEYVPWTDEDSIREHDIESEFQRETLVPLPRRKFTEKRLVQVCLQALLSHSTIREHCIAMVDLKCLQLFHKILRQHSLNPMIKSVIGKIIANLSVHKETHKAIFVSGWVGILARWKQDPNLVVALPATKALCNLDHEYSGDIFKPGTYLILPDHRTVRHINVMSNWGVDIVFIHGLLGGVFYSWRQQDVDNSKGWLSSSLISTDDYSYCWPRDWLNDLSDHIRVIGVDFDSYVTQWGNTCPSESFKTSLRDRSEEILEKLKACGIGKRPVIFVGHSMGGLIIKQMLLLLNRDQKEDVEFLRNTKGIVFYGTPHRGSRAAKLSPYSKYLFFPTTEVQDLEADSPKLLELYQKFIELAETNEISQIISFGETMPTPFLGMDLTFVPTESSYSGVGEHQLVNCNHMNICKPSGRRSILFRKLHRLVWDVLDEATPFE